MIPRTNFYAGGHRSGLAIQNPNDRKSKTLRIQLYSNGFLVGDGPFRPLSDPSNAEFLAELRDGNVPEELRPIAVEAGGALPIDMEQFEGDYDPNTHPTGFTPYSSASQSSAMPTRPAMFSGEGSTLGGSSSKTPVVSADCLGTPDIDQALPSTTLQIRLPGGVRTTRKFNESSNGLILLKLLSEGLQTPGASIVISAGFPPRPIEHAILQATTLKDLGLCNSTVNVSLK